MKLLCSPVIVGDYTLPAITDIAMRIKRDWPLEKRSPYAAPYLNAMMGLVVKTDHFYSDDGDSLVRYFLSNARTYRGVNAKENKALLKAHVGIKLNAAERELVQAISYQLEESRHV